MCVRGKHQRSRASVHDNTCVCAVCLSHTMLPCPAPLLHAATNRTRRHCVAPGIAVAACWAAAGGAMHGSIAARFVALLAPHAARDMHARTPRAERNQMRARMPMQAGGSHACGSQALELRSRRAAPPQVLLRWGLQHGACVIPKSVRAERTAVATERERHWVAGHRGHARPGRAVLETACRRRGRVKGSGRPRPGTRWTHPAGSGALWHALCAFRYCYGFGTHESTSL
jgi:hypothetical protein